MFRSKFFYKFFTKKQNNSDSIVKYNEVENHDFQNEINNQILIIDKEISENSTSLMEAQIVRFKSTFSKSNSFLEKIGKNAYKRKLEESINWHQKQLKELYLERKELQIKLEKIKGIYWLNRIKRLLKIIGIGFLMLFIFFILISGFMVIIYLLPLLISISLIYWITTKKY